MKTGIGKLVSAMVLGSALVVPALLPADASAQGRSDRDRRGENGRHLGWNKNGKDRDRNDRWGYDSDRRYGIDATRRQFDNRQTQKNNWRNLGIAGGAAGLYGLLTGNKTVAALGLGGGLYSAYRYEQDRKSQNRLERDRYSLFNRSSFDYNGNRYVRRERSQNGQRYYYFQRQR